MNALITYSYPTITRLGCILNADTEVTQGNWELTLSIHHCHFFSMNNHHIKVSLSHRLYSSINKCQMQDNQTWQQINNLASQYI